MGAVGGSDHVISNVWPLQRQFGFLLPVIQDEAGFGAKERVESGDGKENWGRLKANIS